MTKRVAAITDATSSGELFPYWHRYYGEQIGYENLYLLSYHRADGFERFPLGGHVALGIEYSDPLRSVLIGDLVRDLLRDYEIVIRVDVDEFLVPRRASSLQEYLTSLSSPHVSAVGLDIIQTQSEPPLILDGEPLLGQRRFCVPTAANCKIAIVTQPLAWSLGFHFANAPPIFDDLFLFHWKFADIGRRVAWFDRMRARCAPGSSEEGYFSDAHSKLTKSAQQLLALPRRQGQEALDCTAFQARLVDSVIPPAGAGFYEFPFFIDECAREIAGTFRIAF